MKSSREVGIAVPGNQWDRLNGVNPETLPSISVVIAHYRQQRQLDRTLRGLRSQDYPADLIQIIIVDDGSPEPPGVPIGVRLIVQEDLGFRLSAARNRGAAAAQNEIICFLDADTTPEPDYLRAITRLPALAPDCVTVGRRRHADFERVPLEASVAIEGPRHALSDPSWLRDAYRTSRNLLDADDRSYRFMIGAVIACRRDFFDLVGGYDENFTEYGGEDWEWAYRAWLAGAIFAHVPEAVAWHDGPEWTDRTLLSQQAEKNRESIRLTELIPIPGSRGYGIRPRHADILLELSAEHWSVAARFESLDSALADIPEAHVQGSTDVATNEDHSILDRVRIRIEIHQPVRVGRGALRHAVNRISSEQLARVIVTDDADLPLLTLTSARATSRHVRWDGTKLFDDATYHDPRILSIGVEPDLEGYLGGWR